MQVPRLMMCLDSTPRTAWWTDRGTAAGNMGVATGIKLADWNSTSEPLERPVRLLYVRTVPVQSIPVLQKVPEMLPKLKLGLAEVLKVIWGGSVFLSCASVESLCL